MPIDTAVAPPRPSAGSEDYDAYVARFSAAQVTAELAGDLVTGLNACVECCDRYAGSGRIALHWENRDGHRADWSFTDLQRRAAQLAHVLVERGVQPGDRVAGLLPRIPELVILILATWRMGAVYQPLFTAFGPKSIEHRLKSSGARLVVTDTGNRPKLDTVEDCPPVLIVADPAAKPVHAADGLFWAELERHPAAFTPVLRRGDDPFLMMFTSGTTGLAKGVMVPLKALLSFHVYMRDALDLRPDDVFWNIADPGWAYGLYYAVTGPLLLGHATTLYDGPFTAESTYALIGRRGITNLAGAPTAFRLLIAAGEQAAAPVRGQLRVVSSAGEALNPEVIRWFREHLDCPIHDHYGQTEVGMVLCNHHRLRHPVRPGGAGLPLPGYRLAVLNASGEEVPTGAPGILAVDRVRSKLFWFGGYWQQETASWCGDFHLTGDTVERNEDGTISFVGRTDDIITSSGYRIGPFDVESALLEHPAVAETAVIGRPDPERTELVKAFVVLRQGHAGTPALAEALQALVKARLAAHAYPREIEFVDQLPKTPSGKLQRFILRQQEIARATPPTGL